MNVEKIRKDFSFFDAEKPLIYMDSTCVTLRPRQVVDSVKAYYEEYPACGGRSTHRLARRVDDGIHRSRNSLRKLINARKDEEIVFSKNCTEGLNLVYNSLGLGQGDIIITSDKEHNSNLLPAQMLAKNKNCIHKFPDSKDDNTFDIEAFESLMNKDVKLVSFHFTSNLDGTTTPVKEIVKIAHENGALVLVDGAQAVPHKETDVKKLDIDFMSFSGHKMFGPSGTGVLYGKYDLLDELKTFIVGGETVKDSWYDKVKFEGPPYKFEAGLQHYAGIIGLGEAARYLMSLGVSDIQKHEIRLNALVSEELLSDDRISVIGPDDAEKRSGILNFNIKGVDSHKISTILDETYDIMTRSGFHCVHSWYNKHNLQGSTRASFFVYNTEEECRVLIDSMKKIVNTFSK